MSPNTNGVKAMPAKHALITTLLAAWVAGGVASVSGCSGGSRRHLARRCRASTDRAHDGGSSDAGSKGAGDGGSKGATSAPCAATQIVSGDGHACALLTDGSVWCWGSDTDHQLGTGDSRSSYMLKPVQVLELGFDVTEIQAANDQTCARKKDKTLWCWGADYGATPRAIGIDDVASFAVGDGHVCAVKADGSVACRGKSELGQLGTGSTVGSWRHHRRAGHRGRKRGGGQRAQLRLEEGRHAVVLGTQRQRTARARIEGAAVRVRQLRVSTLARASVGAQSRGEGGVRRRRHDVRDQDRRNDVVLGRRDPRRRHAGTSRRAGPCSARSVAMPCGFRAWLALVCAAQGRHAVVLGFQLERTARARQHRGSKCAYGGNGCMPLPIASDAAGSHVAGVAVESGSTCALDKGGRVHCWGENASGQLGDGTNATPKLEPVTTLLCGITAVARARVPRTAASTRAPRARHVHDRGARARRPAQLRTQSGRHGGLLGCEQSRRARNRRGRRLRASSRRDAAHRRGLFEHRLRQRSHLRPREQWITLVLGLCTVRSAGRSQRQWRLLVRGRSRAGGNPGLRRRVDRHRRRRRLRDQEGSHACGAGAATRRVSSGSDRPRIPRTPHR